MGAVEFFLAALAAALAAALLFFLAGSLAVGYSSPAPALRRHHVNPYRGRGREHDSKKYSVDDVQRHEIGKT